MRFFMLTSALVAISFGASAQAEPYRLAVGDQLSLQYDLIESPRTSTIDLDGNLRLPELGSISAQGWTLDEMEQEISGQMLDAGFSGIPTVSVEIIEYAPVIIAGLAEKGGAYDFVPGMTVGVALAMAGGSDTLHRSGDGLEVASMAARRRSMEHADQVAANILLMARLNAFLSGDDQSATLTNEMRDAIPNLTDADIEQRLEGENIILASKRQSDAALLQSWDQEIAEGGKQTELLDQRIALKGEIIAQLTSELDNTNALQQKGLSTNSRALEAWRRLAEEREDLLALENAKLTARRAIGMAERTRLNHLSEQRQTALVQLQNAKSRLASAQQNYLLSLNEIALLTGGLDSLSSVTGGASLVFEIRGPRAESFAAQVVTINTELMPGDILVVSADLAG